MDEWFVSYADGGWSFTAAGESRCQVTFHFRAGVWSVVCTRYPAGRRQRASYGARAEGETGLHACLGWAEQYLANAGEPPFDALEARERMR